VTLFQKGHREKQGKAVTAELSFSFSPPEVFTGAPFSKGAQVYPCDPFSKGSREKRL
jgi:hypothetical protein